MGKKAGNRKHSKIDALDPALRETVEQMLLSGSTYSEIVDFLGANGVALDAGFTTPDPEEAAVKAAVVRRAREAWFLVDDSRFARIYPAVIAELSGGAILTNHCPNPKYRQFTLVKEAAE